MAFRHSSFRKDVAVRLLLLVVTIAIVTLGYASPIDPSWIAGLYDDSDYDDIVTLVTQAAGALSGHRALVLEPSSTQLLPRPATYVPGQPLLLLGGRAPPWRSSPSLLASDRVSRLRNAHRVFSEQHDLVGSLRVGQCL